MMQLLIVAHNALTTTEHKGGKQIQTDIVAPIFALPLNMLPYKVNAHHVQLDNQVLQTELI
jgi:hypothetical protein